MPAADPPPRPPPYVPPPQHPGAAEGRPADGPGSIAGIAERVGARAIDAVVLFVLMLPIIAAEAGIRAATGIEESEEGDGITTAMGLVMLVVILAYDPIATKLLGASVGKRTLGLRVECASGGPAEPLRVTGRWCMELVLLGLCCVPGFLSIALARNQPLRQTWYDKAAGTIVVRTKAAGAQTPPAAQPAVRPAVWSAAQPTVQSAAQPPPEPWASLVVEARAASARFDQTAAAANDGPMKVRLERARAQVQGCVADCERLARRGAEVAALASAVDLPRIEERAQAAEADAAARQHDPDAAALAAAVRNEATSARELTEMVGASELRLRRSVAQLNDAVNRSAQLVYDSCSPSTFDHLIDEFAALQAALAETATELRPRVALDTADPDEGTGP